MLGRGPCSRHVACSKVYAMGEVDVHALRDVDLDLVEGELVVLLGPSGSGKSTLLNILGGLDVATTGHGAGSADSRPDHAPTKPLTEYRRQHVGFVFQFYNLIPSLTARENVALVTEIVDHPMTPEEALALVGPRRIVSITFPRSCRAASSSAWPLRAPSPSVRRRCSATSRPARSIWPPASSCSRPSSASTETWAPRPSSSPTTRRSRVWPTRSSGSPMGAWRRSSAPTRKLSPQDLAVVRRALSRLGAQSQAAARPVGDEGRRRIAIALVIGAGIAMFVAYLSNFDSLETARDAYYARHALRRRVRRSARAPPNAWPTALRLVPGVEDVETRVVADVVLDVPGLAEPATGRLVSIPARRTGRGSTSSVMRRGTWVVAAIGPTRWWRARPSSRRARLRARRARGRRSSTAAAATLTIVGVAISPEYLFSIRPGELVPDPEAVRRVLDGARGARRAPSRWRAAFNDVAVALAPDSRARCRGRRARPAARALRRTRRVAAGAAVLELDARERARPAADVRVLRSADLPARGRLRAQHRAHARPRACSGPNWRRSRRSATPIASSPGTT